MKARCIYDWFVLYGSLCLLGFFYGCSGSGEQRSSQRPTQPTDGSSSAAGSTPSVESTHPKPLPSYNPVGKRDPFRSSLMLQEETTKETRTRKREATETYELDQYRLTGLITGTSQPLAMVEDPEGQGHLIKVGSHLGKQGGAVTRILSTGIVVTVESHNDLGETIRVPYTVSMPQPELDLGPGQ